MTETSYASSDTPDAGQLREQYTKAIEKAVDGWDFTDTEDANLLGHVTDAVYAVRDRAIAELAQAIRLTREYVGADLLPAAPGWSWYDALRRWAPHELPGDADADNLISMADEICPGFPDRCPNLRTIEPNPPEHYGGIRCGCGDAEPDDADNTAPDAGLREQHATAIRDALENHRGQRVLMDDGEWSYIINGPEEMAPHAADVALAVRDNAMQQLRAERDMLGREADRLRRDWVAMHDRAEQAEAAIARVRDLRDTWLLTTLEPGQVRRLLDGITHALDAFDALAAAEICEIPHQTTEEEDACEQQHLAAIDQPKEEDQ